MQMKWYDLIKTSLANLWRRKARTILTMVGTLIGTASIVIMISLGLGLNKEYMDGLMESGGLTTVNINYYDGYYSDSATKLKLDDDALEEISKLEGVIAVTPLMEFYNGNLTAGKYECYSSILGIDPKAAEAFGFDFEEGGMFSDDTKKLEIVIGGGAKRYFRDPKARNDDWSTINELDWLNEKYRYEVNTYNEDGSVTTKKFKMTATGTLVENYSNNSYYIFANIDALKELVKKNKKLFEGVKTDQYTQAWVKVDDIERTIEVTEKINEMGFSAYSDAEYITQQQEQMQTVQLFLGAIGAVAMLVAALSISNTMLMSVYERTKEIGVMKVLGCRLSNIAMLFLSEAALIGLIGGAFGLAFSYGLSFVINHTLSAMLGGSIQSYIPIWLALLGLGFSTGMGVLSGLYPAQRAMRLSALQAIRNGA